MEYLILLITLPVIIFGANMLVTGSVSVARKYNMSDFAIGAVIVGVGTSFPELIVSVIGALQGNSDVAIGNVVGSNIFNVLCILGLTALLFPVLVTKSNLKFDLPLCIIISVIVTLLTFNFFINKDAVIGRIDGFILILIFLFFLYLTFKLNKSGQIESATEDLSQYEESNSNLLTMIVKILGGLTMLVVGCNYFVTSAEKIALNLGVDEAYISITLIACGTSLPELVASLTAAFKKNTQLALGNIIGSNIFNMTWILGASSMITPLNIGNITIIDYLVMIFASIVPLILCRKGKIGRFAGAIFFICFVIYNIYLLNTQF